MADLKDVASVILDSCSIRRPKKRYYENVSMLFRVLSIILVPIRESMLQLYLTKWM